MVKVIEVPAARAAVGGNGPGRPKGSVSKRNPIPEIAVIRLDDVPPTPETERTNLGDLLYAQIVALPGGSALKAEFANEKHGDYVRLKLRKKARADKKFLSSSRSADGRTRYFWLEKL